MSRDWRHDAACRGTGYDMWVTPPHKPGPDRDQLVARARTAFGVCAGCPVRLACHLDAVQGGVVGMIRAGVAYDGDGRPSRPCERCGMAIVCRNGTLARYCSNSCANSASMADKRRRAQEQVAA